jgi:hypothetical protein
MLIEVFDLQSAYRQFAKELHQILWRHDNGGIEGHQVAVPQKQVQVSSHSLLGREKKLGKVWKTYTADFSSITRIISFIISK